jgi:putative FmdB family regulatory protein
MPLYEYQCRACGREFEQLVRAGDPLARCPGCQSDDLERVLSAFAVGSEGKSQRNLRLARRAAAKGSDRVDKQAAEHDYVRDHLAEKGIKIPPLDKPK